MFGQGLHTNKKFNFLKGRVVGLVLSAILSLSAVVLYIKPGLNYGVDFTGGTAIEVLSPNTDLAHLRMQLSANALADASIQEFEQSGRYLVRLAADQNNRSLANEQISALKSSVIAIDDQASFPRVDMIQPG